MTKMAFARQMAEQFGRRVPGFMGVPDEDGRYWAADDAYVLARIAAHFGHIAILASAVDISPPTDLEALKGGWPADEPAYGD
jgi:hypothetical protein